MSNIHAPTVPSGPTTAPVANGRATHLTFPELQRKKDNIEAELKALGGVLDSVNRPFTCVVASSRSLSADNVVFASPAWG